MSASLTRITDHVTAMLNANARTPSGAPVYSSTVGDKARSPMEIEENCTQAAILTAKAICESDSSPFRSEFVEAMDLVHSEVIPFHYGDTNIPDIVPFPGATVTLRGTKRSYEKIEAYRINRNGVYGPVHNASDNGNPSILAGFYDIVNGLFFFTGHTASMLLAIFSRDDVFDKLDEGIEPVIVRLALGLSAKEGDTSDGLFQMWYSQGMSELNEIKQGATAFQPIDAAVAARSDR